MSIAFSKTATRKERERYEDKDTLGVNGQGPKPGPMRKKGRFPRSSERSSDYSATSGESNDQLKNVQD